MLKYLAAILFGVSMLNLTHADESIRFLHYGIELPDGYNLVNKTSFMMEYGYFEIFDPGGVKKAGMFVGRQSGFRCGLNASEFARLMKQEGYCDFQTPNLAFQGFRMFSGLSYKSSQDTPWGTIHFWIEKRGLDDETALVQSFRNITVEKQHIE
ncbi:hypothetical protein KSF73_15485 [Burkholderiaceae bacterium DAT-1]|nr:hypothetical protein [Burkholderiaceae bacterium DAT-1]